MYIFLNLINGGYGINVGEIYPHRANRIQARVWNKYTGKVRRSHQGVQMILVKSQGKVREFFFFLNSIFMLMNNT